MTKFLNYPAVARLKQLAEAPIDLTLQSNLTLERIENYSSEACGFRLLFATERVDESCLAALAQLATESQAVQKMRQMQSGEVLNCIEGYESENRSVLHTAMRDLFDHPNHHKPAKEASELALKQHQKLKALMQTLDNSDQFTDLVMVGIGGSDLGPRAIYLALARYRLPNRRVHFIANVDPDDAAQVLRGLDLGRTLVVVVSKSGTTLETLTNEELVKSHFQKAGLNFKDHFIAVTAQESAMDDKSKYLECFHMWDYVGGRYSTTSMVGGVMLAFGLGYQVFWEFLRGAHEMDQVALRQDYKQNLPLLSALLGIWNRNFLHFQTVAVIPYSQALSRFPAHLQQCDMESNGKHIDKSGQSVDFETGPIIWGEPGTNGQHSFFQLIHQGTAVVPVEFIGFCTSQYGEDITVAGTTSQQKLLANLFAQALALASGKKDSNPNREFSGNRPSRILLGRQLTPYAMGALLAYYENKIAFQGFIWGINSFDQEGVQLGKVLANRVLDLFAGKQGTDYPQGQAYLKQCHHMSKQK